MTVHSSTTNQTFYTIIDPLGTVHALVDATGAVMYRDPMGWCAEEYVREAGRVVDDAIAYSTFEQAMRGNAEQNENVDQNLPDIDTKTLNTIDRQQVYDSIKSAGPKGSPYARD